MDTILKKYLKNQEEVIKNILSEFANNKLILIDSMQYSESDLTIFIYLNQNKLFINFGYGYPVWDEQNKKYIFNKERPLYVIDYLNNQLYINNNKININDYDSLFFLISQHWFESFLSNAYSRKGYLWDNIKSKEAQYIEVIQHLLLKIINEVKNG